MQTHGSGMDAWGLRSTSGPRARSSSWSSSGAPQHSSQGPGTKPQSISGEFILPKPDLQYWKQSRSTKTVFLLPTPCLAVGSSVRRKYQEIASVVPRCSALSLIFTFSFRTSAHA